MSAPRHKVPGVSSEWYPATGRVDWAPLRKLAPLDVCDGFMFMQVDDEGRRFYKHGDTRSYLILSTDGTAWDGRTGEQVPAVTALERALA